MTVLALLALAALAYAARLLWRASRPPVGEPPDWRVVTMGPSGRGYSGWLPKAAARAACRRQKALGIQHRSHEGTRVYFEVR